MLKKIKHMKCEDIMILTSFANIDTKSLQYPENDNDFSTRWRLIKRYFSIGIDNQLNARKEKQVWQRRFWEHLLRDEEDWRRHMDYIHYNPVKHGYAHRPVDWPHSSFMRAVERGYYSADWGAFEPQNITGLQVE